MPREISVAVLLVDPDPEIGRDILAFLSRRHYEVEWVDNGEKAFNRLDSHHFDVLVTELSARRVDGLRLMAVAKERNPDICVVFITQHAEIERATEAMRQGAYDFQLKPVNLGKLDAVIQRGIAFQRLVLQQHELRRRLDEHYGLGSLVGNSRQMVRVYDVVRQAARMNTPVLIQGESGTGKDLIAQAIHNNSPRRDEPFAKVQCGGSPESQVDADLFGYVAGAYRGATAAEPGRIELADKGTLYLDEVGELNSAQQAALLDVIARKQVRRIGGFKASSVDVRVLASTSRPLASGEFLEDLYALLRAVVVEVPALRDRPEDIPLLVEYFVRVASRANGQEPPGITRNALDLLMRYDWPGNVRELKNIAEGMLLTARSGRQLDVTDIPEHIRTGARAREDEIRIALGTPMSHVERTVIEENLKACGFNKERCAKRLGIGLRTLYRKLKEYES